MNFAEQRITEVTRRNIFERISFDVALWSGRLDEREFLARLYDLEKMRSTDPRFRNASEDILQHRVRNRDWGEDWVFADSHFNLLHCPDDEFLGFLCEMVHPVVAANEASALEYVDTFNSELAADGFEITETTRISGRPVFSARETGASSPALSAAKRIGESLTVEYLNQQITRMEAAIPSDPALAIGTAKELIETFCKTILRERGSIPHNGWEIPKLVRATLKELNLIPVDIPRAAEASRSIQKTLGNLAQVAQGAAELRNLFGTGHGNDAETPQPPPRLARLAVGAASTFAVFLFETHQADIEVESR